MTDRPTEQTLSRAERINVRISVTQTILAIVGIFIGSVALYAALGESEAVRKQTEASVWPRLDMAVVYYGFEGEERIDILARNRGIGPAVVEFVHVAVDGAKATSWSEVIRAVAPDEVIATSNQSIERTVVSPNEDIKMLSVEEKYSSNALTRAIRDAIGRERIKVEICYCSVFDSCWKTKLSGGAPDEVDACEKKDPTAF